MVVCKTDTKFELKILMSKENKYTVLTLTKNDENRYNLKKTDDIPILEE
jgi:hypothetical protein